MESLVNPDPNFWKGRSVLLTGHTGFKGSWLAVWLDLMGCKVHGLALPPVSVPNLFSMAVEGRHGRTQFGDIRELEVVKRAVSDAKAEIIFHLAAQSLVRPSYRDPVQTYATNVMGTVHVLEAARTIGSVKAVIVVTSDKCYENKEWVWPYRETERLGGRDPYSNSKGCAELVTSAYRSSFFSVPGEGTCRIASVRAGNVIGGGDWSEDRLIPDSIRAFKSGASLEIRSPHAIRPWQHVLEPLAGYLLVGERLLGLEADKWAEAWNFGPEASDCQPVSYVVGRLQTLWGEGAAWRLSDGEHPHEASFLKVDSSKAKSRLAWQPRLRLDEALGWTVEWYRRQDDGEPADGLIQEQIRKYTMLGKNKC